MVRQLILSLRLTSTIWMSSISLRLAIRMADRARSLRTQRQERWLESRLSQSDADATTNAITYTLDDDAGGRLQSMVRPVS